MEEVKEFSPFVLYAIIAMVSFLVGFFMSRYKDFFAMFKKNSDIRDKKVTMFSLLAIEAVTFATERLVVSYGYSKGLESMALPDVSWGWCALIAGTVLCYLGPDAAVKVGLKWAESKTDKV